METEGNRVTVRNRCAPMTFLSLSAKLRRSCVCSGRRSDEDTCPMGTVRDRKARGSAGNSNVPPVK